VVGSASYRIAQRTPEATVTGMKASVSTGASLPYTLNGESKQVAAADAFATLVAYLKNVGETVRGSLLAVSSLVLQMVSKVVYCVCKCQVIDRPSEYAVMVIPDDATQADREALQVCALLLLRWCNASYRSVMYFTLCSQTLSKKTPLGLKSVYFISESSAACLAYGLDSSLVGSSALLGRVSQAQVVHTVSLQ